MNSNKGISMVELVIVIIIMILIAGFATFGGKSSLEKAEATEVYGEITNVKKAVNGVIAQMELEDGDTDWLNGYYDRVVNKDEGWYEIYGINQDGYQNSLVRDKLNLDSIKRNYMVNYETGEVMLSEATTILGRNVRTYESIRAIMESDKI